MNMQDTQTEPVHVLLVEDNEDHAELVLRSLEDIQVASTVHHVTDGEMALDYLRRRGPYGNAKGHPRPRVVLLDLRIPKIDGLEVLREIKESEHLRDIPVVILTSSQAERDVVKAYEHHANSYLVKPVGFDSFSRMMQDLGVYWLARNHCPWS